MQLLLVYILSLHDHFFRKIRQLGALCGKKFWLYFRHKPFRVLNTNERKGFALKYQAVIVKDSCVRTSELKTFEVFMDRLI